MANGVIKCQSEYYNDPVTYTGDPGSATNKAVIEDVYDLVAWSNVIDQNGAYDRHYNYGIIINDINFNDHSTYKYGIPADVYAILDCSFRGWGGELDGGGHTIYNMVVKQHNSSVIVGTYKNIKFKNVIAINQSYKIFSGTFTNCDMAVFCSNSKPGDLVSGSFTNSTFLFKGLCSTSLFKLSASTTFLRCEINFDIQISNPTGWQIGGPDRDTRITLDNTAIIGRVTGNSYPNVYLTGVNLTNSYIALNTNITFSYTGDNSDGVYATSCSFIDKTIMANVPESPPANLYYLTTEQAQSPSYLLNIGFITA